MLFKNIYFKFLCKLKRYEKAEKFIEKYPSLKNIRYLI